KVKIQYAAKQSSISNGYKKWIGESIGLKETKALDKKRQYEAEFTLFAKGTKDFNKYKDLLPQFKALYDQREALSLARRYFIETALVNVSSMSYGFSLYRMHGQLDKQYLPEPENKPWYAFLKLKKKKADVEKQQEALGRLKKSYEGHFKNLDTPLDKSILSAVLKLNVNDLEKGQYPERYDNITAKSLDKIYAKSALVNQDIMEKILNMKTKKASKKLLKDPLYGLVKAHADFYFQHVAGPYSDVQDQIDRLMRDYMQAQMEVFSDKTFYPDANSTLRLSYGKVEGMNPKDALHYKHQTYLEGVMAKYIPGDYEYDLPEKLIELYQTKNYGNYADANGKMPVCFIASNHTTGGNSGSPAINGKGQLIGLNFDRAWEGTMSDLNYDLSRCRNIMVDARYILFIVDKFAGASHLIEEMEIID
ncbi:MAG: S46 family peptidase, partial [Flavobacteriales bacterium]